MIFIRFLVVAIIGNVTLLMLLWFVGSLLPKAPLGVADNSRQSWQSTFDGDY